MAKYAQVQIKDCLVCKLHRKDVREWVEWALQDGCEHDDGDSMPEIGEELLDHMDTHYAEINRIGRQVDTLRKKLIKEAL